MLTPIRIRGRRKNPENGAPKPVPSGPKGGRPMLTPAAKRASSQTETGSNKRARLLVAKPPPPKPRRKLSTLESLPVELVEKIFLYSLNVNLPRCSRSIATAISSERIYRALLLFALWDNDREAEADRVVDRGDESAQEADEDGKPVSAAQVARAKRRYETRRAADVEISRLLRPLEYISLNEDERRDLQVSILTCRWCTIDRLPPLLPDLMRLNIWQVWLAYIINMPRDQKRKLHQFLAQGGSSCEFTDRGQEEDEEIVARLSVEPLVSMHLHAELSMTRNTTSFAMFGFRHIPDKFLCGADEGFSEAHTRSLEYLRVASGLNDASFQRLPRYLSYSREALQQGIHTALIEHNAEALTTLLKLDESLFRHENQREPIPYMLPSDHFRTAVRVARDDPGLFQLLLRTSAESIPSDDSEITHWAITLNDDFGPWLLDFMMQLPERARSVAEDPTSAPMFYFGGWNMQLPIGERYLRHVLGVEELGQWIQETPYDISKDYEVKG
ncbi:uncharacterized protein BDV14DRAFT_31199 [Aspergillus stella-maris]|uniref:uncharacterized protein n=1 Tax=Aspergillus stella-maris TaxID=1810926 RepID=UPI003CCE0F32